MNIEKNRRPKLFIPLLLVSLLGLNACSNLIGATSEEPISSHPGKRTIGTMIDDEQLETIAKVNISKASEALKHAHINVTSYNGVVLLTGQVPDAQQRELAAKTVNALPKSRQVYNELRVQGKTSLLARSNDSWLTTKVKGRLVAEKGLAGSRIKVVTEDGVVYLMGLLSRSEADLASEISRTTGGVQKVVKAVEYIN
jgi:osmotically-inducible protein OsmY